MVRKNGYWWAMAAGLVALLFLIYLTRDIQHWHEVSAVLNSSGTIVELLKRQEQGLITLWNASSSQGSAQADALLTQIKLNRQIQQLVGSNSDGSPLLCHQQQIKSRQMDKLVKWQPWKDRYLLVVCTSGQMSNHLICLEKHMFFAALLNRTLVLPNASVDYDYERSLDIAHMRTCLGANTVLSFPEFAALGKSSEVRLLCYMSGCYLDEDREKELKNLSLSWSSKTDAWSQPDGSLKQYHAADIIIKFSCADELLVVGDLFYADVDSELVSQTGGPLQHSCQTIIRPNRLILLTAERFLQTYLGDDFMALHFRRHGFLKFCNVKNESCFFPIPQAASCISTKLQQSKPRVMYVSSDAADSEINLLQSLLTPAIPMVERPQHDSREKWDALLLRKGLLADSGVIAMLDKTICALSKVFIGTPGSTFTDDIMRLRREWGRSNSCDCYLCQGQHPSFIAETD